MVSSEDGTRQASRTLRLVLVDDHALLRQGLRALLELNKDFVVVGEAGSSAEALERVAELQPDVILCDVGLPGRSGISTVADFRRVSPGSRVLLITAHATEEYIRAALDVKAEGYVLKDTDFDELRLAIRTVAGGRPYLCKVAADVLLSNYVGDGHRPLPQSPMRSVTPRERQVLAGIASGKTNKFVARELKVSVKTVEKHRANMMRKLGLHNAADITRFALIMGLVGTAAALDSPVVQDLVNLLP